MIGLQTDSKEHKKERTIWLMEANKFSIRVKALEQECDKLKSRLYTENAPNQNRKVRSTCDAQDYLHEIRSSLKNLKKYCNIALEVLFSIEKKNENKYNGNNADRLWTNAGRRKCKKCTDLYEKELTALTVRMNEESHSMEKDYVFYDNDVQHFLTKIETWKKSFSSNSNNHDIPICKKKLTKQTPKEDPSEIVAQIDEKIAQDGGKNGKFHPDEHIAFVKVWKRMNGDCKNILQATRKYASMELKLRADEEIIEHVNWYSKYLKRIEKKRQCINTWKERKNKEMHSDRKYEKTMYDEHSMKKVDVDKQRKEDNCKNKVLVAAWKKQKEEKEREQKQVEERLLKESKVQDIIMQEKKRKKLHEQIAKHKLNQENEQLQKEDYTPRYLVDFQRFTSTQIEERREKDIKQAKEKRALKLVKQNQVDERTKRIGKLGHSVRLGKNVIRDPERLNRQTKTSLSKSHSACDIENRCTNKKKLVAHDRPVAFQGRDLMSPGMRKAIPCWRQGL